MYPPFNHLPPEDKLLVLEVLDEHQKKFKSFEDLKKRFAKLPHRHQHSDTQNATYDQARLNLVVDVLKYIKTYTHIISLIQSQETHPLRKEWIERLSLGTKRELFVIFAYTLFNTSGGFRGQFKPYLGPSPFTWETFEHFGSLMLVESQKPYNILQRANSVTASAKTFQEYHDKEHIIESMIDKVINKDIDALIDFFSKIKDLTQGIALTTPLQNQTFIGIKALTRRLIDTQTFSQLLVLTNNYSLSKKNAKKVNKITDRSTSIKQFTLTLDGTYAGRIRQESSLLYTHAALRRLEKIGELTTGKYFSNAWKHHDRTIDWDAILTVRNTIAHQDESDNHTKAKELISKKQDLVKMLSVDIPQLHKALQKLCEVRNNHAAQYERATIENFGDTLINNEEAAVQAQITHNQNQGNAAPPTQSVKLSKAQRIAQRQAQEQARAAAKAAVQNSYVGLETIRAYAQKFNAPHHIANCLTPIKRVELALEALKNIKFFFKNEEQTPIHEKNKKRILEILQTHEFLNDAVEYNFLQFLQHLETIREYHEIKNHQTLINHYDSLRYLRNHIAHGALLLDTESYKPEQAYGRPAPHKLKMTNAVIEHTHDFINLLESALVKMRPVTAPTP